MITIKFSDATNEDFIADVLRLDEESYPEKYRGTAQSVSGRYRANRESYVLAYHGGIFVGYLCFFPIVPALSGKISKGDLFWDDNIEPKQIAELNKNIAYDILLLSVAVKESYRGQGIASKMLEAFFAYLGKKIQDGTQVGKIYAEAVSAGGESLLLNQEFKFVKRNGEAKLYAYSFDDFKDADLYIFLPLVDKGEVAGMPIKSVKAASARTAPEINAGEREEDWFISELEDVSADEFANEFPEKLKRSLVGKEKLAIYRDSKEDKSPRFRDCSIYVTAFGRYRTAIILVRRLGMEPTDILNQCSAYALKLQTAEGEISFEDYAQKLGLTCCGSGRCMTTLTQKPRKEYLVYLLAGESYVNSYVKNTAIISPDYVRRAEENLAEYDFSEIYAGEKNLVYVLKHGNTDADRSVYQSLMIFLMELVMLQICAISSNNIEIVKYLSETRTDRDLVERIAKEIAGATELWNLDNLKFSLAKHLFSRISQEFCVEQLKANFESNFNRFEKLTSVSSQMKTEDYSDKTKKFFTAFTVLSGITTLGAVIKILFDVVNNRFAFSDSLMTLVMGVLSAVAFLLLVIRPKGKKPGKCAGKTKVQEKTTPKAPGK